MRLSVTKTGREKYSEIEITWWEEERSTATRFMWWLPEDTTFSVNGEEVRIPITENDDGDTKIVYEYISPIKIISNANSFPVKGTQTGSKESKIVIFGTEDNLTVTASEFRSAGGSVTLDYDPETTNHEVVITPPSENIGTNKDFSITLEGSVPAIVIAGTGTKFVKRKQRFRTSHYGKVHSTLEVDMPHVTNRDTLYDVSQRLIEKYSQDQLQFDVEWVGDEVPVLDNNVIVPQSKTVDNQGNSKSSTGFHFNRIGGLTDKTLSEISYPNVPLSQIQYYLRAYIN